MSQDNRMMFSPLVAVLVGVAVGATATYFMRREEREKAIKKYKMLRTKAETMIADTKQKVADTKEDLHHWAQEMSEKAEREAQKIEADAKKRKMLAA